MLLRTMKLSLGWSWQILILKNSESYLFQIFRFKTLLAKVVVMISLYVITLRISHPSSKISLKGFHFTFVCLVIVRWQIGWQVHLDWLLIWFILSIFSFKKSQPVEYNASAERVAQLKDNFKISSIQTAQYEGKTGLIPQKNYQKKIF